MSKYRLLYDLPVHTRPGLEAPVCRFHFPDSKIAGVLPGNTVVEIDKVYEMLYSSWGHTRFGWVQIRSTRELYCAEEDE